jgi:hypothetical protein
VSPDRPINGTYKMISVALASVLATGLFQYLVIGRDVTTRGTMEDYVQRYSPYAVDKNMIQDKLKTDEDYWKEEHLYQIELDKRLREIEQEVSEIREKLKLPYRKIAQVGK